METAIPVRGVDWASEDHGFDPVCLRSPMFLKSMYNNEISCRVIQWL